MDDDNFKIHGYNSTKVNRQNKGGGRICIFTRITIVKNLAKVKMISNLLGILSINYLILNKNQKASYQGRF